MNETACGLLVNTPVAAAGHRTAATTILAAVLGSIVFLVAPMAGAAAAQERPSPTIEAEGGWMGFADDGIVNESVVGATARWYVSPRISVGPEVLYVSGSNHSHLILTGNLAYDLLSPTNGRPRRVTPFLVAGGGLFQTRETFVDGDFTSTEGAFTAGGGVRASLGDRVTIGIDTRIGWELHLRVNGFVGLRLGR
jgi:hypothetical protein